MLATRPARVWGTMECRPAGAGRRRHSRTAVGRQRWPSPPRSMSRRRQETGRRVGNRFRPVLRRLPVARPTRSVHTHRSAGRGWRVSRRYRRIIASSTLPRAPSSLLSYGFPKARACLGRPTHTMECLPWSCPDARDVTGPSHPRFGPDLSHTTPSCSSPSGDALPVCRIFSVGDLGRRCYGRGSAAARPHRTNQCEQAI